MRKILSSLLFVLLLFLAVPSEAGTATLYKGSAALGQIPTMDSKEGYVISIIDAGALLGLQASASGEELTLQKGADKLRLILNATAAWYNMQLVPLYGATFVENDRMWLDVPSSLSLLQRFAGRKDADRLRVEEIQGGAETKTAAQAPEPQQPANQVVVISEPAPVKTVQPAQVQVQNQTQAHAQIKQPPAQAAQTASPSIPSPSISSSSQSQAELRELRWSTSREKIRAVADCIDGVDPEIKAFPGGFTLTFASAVADLKGVPSPYENVKVELKRDAKGSATLAFSASGVKVEKLVLNEPRRIVLDFVFTSPTTIKETPAAAQAPAVPAAGAGREAPRRTGKLLVVLDPGHGGHDPGAVGNGLKEKDINLSVGLKMENALKSKGIDVLMTRRTDVYLKLQERTEIANKADADMFVSVHVNSLPPGKNSSGFEIYLMALPTDKDALALAQFENREYLEDKGGGGASSDRRTELLLKILGDMQQNNKINESTVAAEVLFKAGNSSKLPMRRVAQAPFFVLRGAGMPAVLLEMGFISNANEAKLLALPAYQQRIADSMANGISNYLK